MDQYLTNVMDKHIQRAMDALAANNMAPYYVKTAAEVRDFVKNMLPKGCTVGCGGSQTLAQTGVLELLASGEYDYLDRAKTKPEEMAQLFCKCFSADWYLTSANAITMQGELYNVDGNANRIAAIAFGPANVLVVAGVNKLVADLDAADRRVRQVAAPANAMRLSCATPCAATGKCQDCHSPSRICCDTLISRYQRISGRIRVLLVGEELGY